MFDDTANEGFKNPISKEELLRAIKAFKKDKSPGPDGWPIEFFSHLFDLFKTDLLRMVEASRMSGSIHTATSSTFIALIPKKERFDSFHDFRPISLCNIMFKIISRIIAERMKHILNSFISRDQHAFLKGRIILDAVAMTQESLFSMLSNNLDAAILKIDLQKAYDCVDWGFLRILLAKIRLKSQSINWVMSCVENVRYSVIVNGILRLSSKRREVSDRDVPYPHYSSFWVSWACINDILLKFQKAKSSLFHNDSNMEIVLWISEMMDISPFSIKDGFKYLGFNLKAKGNSKRDWQWLLDRFYKKISGWEFKFLSLAGRFILVQAVLSQLSVDWAHIFFLPASIINRMNTLAANFLWGGHAYQNKFHLVKMASISKPRRAGGWGLLDMRSFGKELLCKSLYRGIFGDGPWSKIIRAKYLKGKSIEFSYRRCSIGIRRGSTIWQSLRKVHPFFMDNL
eukprot:PITA_29607